MTCPHCNDFAPDTNYLCPHCGKVLQPEKEPADFGARKRNPFAISSTTLILLIIIVGIAVLIYAYFSKGKKKVLQVSGSGTAVVSTAAGGTAAPPAAKIGNIINAENPGYPIRIEDFVKKGKTTIFDFYSDYCGPCVKLSPLLVRLDDKRDDIVVCKVDINRPGIKSIDWDSPLVQQFKLSSIPHFVIYDTSGKRAFEGREAYTEVIHLLQAEELIK